MGETTSRIEPARSFPEPEAHAGAGRSKEKPRPRPKFAQVQQESSEPDELDEQETHQLDTLA